MLLAISIRHDEYRRHGKQVIIDTALIGDDYETVVMYPGGELLAEAHNATEAEAIKAHEDFTTKYILDDGLLPDVKLSGKYLRLVDDLKAAAEAAEAFKDYDDGGTSNFDDLMLSLPRFEEIKIKAAAKRAGLTASAGRCMKQKIYRILPPHGGQGFRRTKQAEAMAEVMRARGYEASVWYQMD